MPLFSKLSSLWHNLFHKTRIEQDLDEEARSYIEMLTEENIKTGKSPEEARRAALIQFGGIDQVKERVRDVRVGVFLETLWYDVRYAARSLAKSRGFTAVAVLTLALGIGGTTMIFSLIYCGMLDPFPYADSRRLMVLISRNLSGDKWAFVSPAELGEYQRQNHVFDEVIGSKVEDTLLTRLDGPARFLQATRVTGNYFSVLGVQPLIGRPLLPRDGGNDAPPVAVLSQMIWERDFGSDPDIVGRTVVLNRQPTTVVGVMPSRLALFAAHIWLPQTPATDRNAQWQYYSMIGHLKPGVSIKEAKADVAVLSKQFATARPTEHQPGTTETVEPLSDSLISSNSRRTLYILLGAVGLLFLIACVNVANLLLARATGRGRELAIRAALGARRGVLLRQLLIESMLLALGGAVLGCLVSWNLLEPLAAIFPPLPSEAVIRINGPVLLFTLGAALLSTLLFGLAPALLSLSKDLEGPLKQTGRGTSDTGSRSRIRALLVVSEVALSLVLLTGAGLLIRSFMALLEVKPGFDSDHVLSAGFLLPKDRYKTAEQRSQFYEELLKRVRALPGVVSASAYGVLADPVLGIYAPRATIQIDGASDTDQQAAIKKTGDRYFETLGIPLLEGRPISQDDLAGNRRVAVINQAFANTFFRGENSLGHRIKVTKQGRKPGEPMWYEVVGIVGNIKDTGPDNPPQPVIHVPIEASNAGGPIYVRTLGEPKLLVNALRHEIAAIDKEVPISGSSTSRELLDGSWFQGPRFVFAILTSFGALGLVLVSVGVYSVLSYAVSRKTHEIGIRMALGAQPTDVRRMVMMSGLRWLGIGIGIGVPASIALARILQSRIWGIKSADPLTLIAVSLVLIAVGLIACYFPARRATSVDPIVALRYE
jgi:predicted permease